MKGAFEKTTLKNGVRVLTERHPFSKSVCIGFWVHFGARDEAKEESGIAHFIEHLVFKGTKKRSAFQIASSLETLGGDLNAFTSKESTCFHAVVLKEHIEKAVDVLSDLVSNMDFKKKDFDLEKSVILQELAMVEENHEEQIYDDFFAKVYHGNNLARPILGTMKSLANMKIQDVYKRYKSTYNGHHLIISITGDVEHQQAVSLVSQYLRLKNGSSVSKTLSKKSSSQKTLKSVSKKRKLPKWSVERWVLDKPSEQVHLLWGIPTVSFKSSDRFCAFILNSALGGGMTSRLYQAVREKRGLVYTIQSSLNTFEDTGLITIYAAADLDHVKQIHQIVLREITKLKIGGITQKQLDDLKTQLIGSLLMGSDDIDNRMHSLAINEMVFGEYKPVEVIVAEIEKIDRRQVNKFLKDNLDLDRISYLARGEGVNQFTNWWEG